MLNHSKVLQALHNIHDKIFVDTSQEVADCRTLWQKLNEDIHFFDKLSPATRLTIPLCYGQKRDGVVMLDQQIGSYAVLAVDGSQIYPDRHQGTMCHLVNIGTALVVYDVHRSHVILDSQPHVYTPEDYTMTPEFAIDLVDCKRQELEFEYAVRHALARKQQLTIPLVVLIDGALLFWHLHNKEGVIKQYFLQSYCALLEQLYQNHIPTAGYISVPKSKELVQHITAAQQLYSNYEHHAFEHIVDVTIARFFVQPWQRTAVFATCAAIASSYPEHLRPCFFYMHVEHEIVRIEVPYWIIHDAPMLDQVCAVIIDQVRKGYGYPVVLAEAHEQAVVKGADREFFYHMVQKISYTLNKKISISEKARKKRAIGI